MEPCWLLLVCGAVLGVAETTMALAVLASSPPAMVASTASSSVESRAAPAAALAGAPGPDPALAKARAHLRSEEPRMNFTLRLVDGEHAGDPNDVKRTHVFIPGSPIHVEARVEFSPGISLKIYVDECYGTDSKHLGRSRRIYVVVNNRGCLRAQKLGSVTWRRRGASALQLIIPAFMLGDEPEEEVFLHCLLAAWGTEAARRHGQKSCYYSDAPASWQNVEDPSQSTLCDCCDTHCPAGGGFPRELPDFPGEGILHQKMVGPLLIQKETPWYEARCRTVKRLLLASMAFVGSALVAAALVGGLLVLGLAVSRLHRRDRRRRPLKTRQRYPFHAELQTVVGALAVSEGSEKQQESSVDHSSPKHGTA